MINYRGVRHARFEGTEAEPLVVVSGQNGTGKSLIFHALNAFWGRVFRGAEDTGPWGDTTSIELGLSLTEEEREAIKTWGSHVHSPETAGYPEFTGKLVYSRSKGRRTDEMGRGMHLLQTDLFKDSLPFATIDFLPAVRYFPLSSEPSVDLALLSDERVRQERRQINQRGGPNDLANFPSITNYLAALDYEHLLNDREGVEDEDVYALIQDAFKSATGKQLTRPKPDPGSAYPKIKIKLPNGHVHPLEALSSGEQGMLGMMYYIRRLSASGGILLIDEPELHLHPSLQAGLFSTLQNLAERSQVWMITHSPKLLSLAPNTAAFQLQSPAIGEENQVRRLQDEPSRQALMSELGITAAALLQSDLLLVLEGETDAKWLRELLPVELGRAHLLVAGSGKEVLAAHRTLEGSPVGIPWLCVIDRDLMSDAEVDGLKRRYGNLHVWPFREIESLFLSGDLIHSALQNAGFQVTLAEVERELESCALGLQDDVIYEKTLERLSKDYPAPSVERGVNKYDAQEKYLRDYSVVAAQKADALASVQGEVKKQIDSQWALQWNQWVDPKAVLGRLHSKFRCFANPMAFKDALTARIRLDGSVEPPALAELKVRILGSLT
ncbi:ATP-binding protein [Streptomyces parvulus]|uniref:AAA family ATPase n=1 Tax=Streptomyces parvulus TaxID=146923 RepID=UPI0015F1180C|nr:ATP-binding protein [Streptomyces parvulus]